VENRVVRRVVGEVKLISGAVFEESVLNEVVVKESRKRGVMEAEWEEGRDIYLHTSFGRRR